MRILRQHGPAAVLFAALAVVWTFPLILHLSTHLPGPTIGDNVLFLWNFWSMRTALTSGTNFFYSYYLFAPVGIDLTLSTHTALPALIGATCGRLVLSGILDSQLNTVVEQLHKYGAENLAIVQDGEWVALIV